MDLEQKSIELTRYIGAVVERFAISSQETPDVFDLLSNQEVNLILVAGRNEPGPMSNLAQKLNLSLSSVTGIVDRLVDKHLVCRERSEEDRRVVRVGLTEGGQKMYDQIFQAHLKISRGMMAMLNESEQDALLGLIRRVASAIDEKKEK
ncbi:MAG: MarR family transcriptional regulator [Elusimicrobiota bacterium]